MARLVRAVLSGWLASSALPLAHLAAAAPSCRETAGPAKAKLYVDQCLKVSPATHPPCNAADACALIQDEIRRGCGLLGKNAPAFCHADPRSDPAKPWPRSD